MIAVESGVCSNCSKNVHTDQQEDKRTQWPWSTDDQVCCLCNSTTQCITAWYEDCSKYTTGCAKKKTYPKSELQGKSCFDLAKVSMDDWDDCSGVGSLLEDVHTDQQEDKRTQWPWSTDDHSDEVCCFCNSTEKCATNWYMDCSGHDTDCTKKKVYPRSTLHGTDCFELAKTSWDDWDDCSGAKDDQPDTNQRDDVHTDQPQILHKNWHGFCCLCNSTTECANQWMVDDCGSPPTGCTKKKYYPPSSVYQTDCSELAGKSWAEWDSCRE
eukprot:TRINITY_DN1425_c0_g1_i5.p1 TRINITY_DN1425_c0_g1~~TRINITY_DN1425_c0_g1_i5.p1  ORF type:complete len:269 (-),score=8.10 TRINITY_DN1425_c0_g1_i5:103-909(-)